MAGNIGPPVEVYRPTRDEFLKYVVSFADVQGGTGSYPPSHLPGCRTVVRPVVGGGAETGDGKLDPLSHPSVVPVRGDYTLSFIEAAPGNGAALHWRDTSEAFLILEGTWLMTFAGAEGADSVLVGPRDTVAVPPNILRGFECVEASPGKDSGLMAVVLIGDAPHALLTQEAIEFYTEHGVVIPDSGVYAAPPR